MADDQPWRWVADSPQGPVVLTVTFDGPSAILRANGPAVSHEETLTLSTSPPAGATTADLSVDDMAAVGGTLDMMCDQLGLTFFPDETPHP